MKQALSIVLVSIGVWSSSCAQTTLPSSLNAERFQALRRVPGHFNGGAWNAEVDAWNGAKHRAMQALAKQAVEQGASTAELQASMGAPDETVACPSSRCETLAARAGPGAAGAQALWVYDWRGAHDRLVFSLAGGKVRAAGWMLAGE